MSTYSGLKINPIQMKVGDVNLVDIAHSLSLICRGAGHFKWFYSVGQHSINCAKEAEARGYSKRIIFACLLHDASEAYISDIIRPVKAYLPKYKNLEDEIMKKILTYFKLAPLSDYENKVWKKIDDDLLDNELRQFMKGQENREAVDLVSIPNFLEVNHKMIEMEFRKLAIELGAEI